MTSPQSTTSTPGAASATYPIGTWVSVPSQYRPGRRVNGRIVGAPVMDDEGRPFYGVELLSGPEFYSLDEIGPVVGLDGTSTPVTLTWQVQVERAREADRRPGAYNGQGACFAQRERLTAAQCAEMTADLAAMGVL